MTSTLIVGTDGGVAMTDENPHAAQIHLVSRAVFHPDILARGGKIDF